MKTGAQMIGEAFAAMMLTVMRLRDQQWRHATPPRLHKRIHDRAEGPAGVNPTIHMLVRSVNKGYTGPAWASKVRPHIHPRHERAA